MSAVIAVMGEDAVHLLTDASVTAVKDGTLVKVQPKQAITSNRTAIAGLGLWAPCARFVRLADERARNYDEVAERAPDLWEEAQTPLSAEEKKIFQVLLYAGYSDKRQRLDLTMIENGERTTDLAAYVAGPSRDEAFRRLCQSSADHFGDNPEGFDAHRDGIALMQTMRREFPKQFEIAAHPAVGGFIQHTVVTRAGIETAIIHHWPDLTGRPIDLDASPELPVLYRVREKMLYLASPYAVPGVMNVVRPSEM